MNYGEKMKWIRKDSGLLQKELAKILNLSVYTYSHYETQDTIIPIKHLIAFCDYFNISIDYIFNLSSSKNYPNQIKNMNKKESGKRLKEFRKKNKITQEKLANVLNTTQGVIANYERGRTIISTPFLYTICKTYKISADYILGKVNNPETLN